VATVDTGDTADTGAAPVCHSSVHDSAGHAVRRIFSLVVVLALLLAVDRGAAWLADQALASKIQHSAKLTSAPAVNIEGFPFLVQLVTGRYKRVTVDVNEPASIHGVKIDRFHGDLEGVHAPLADVLGNKVTSLPVDQATVAGHVSFAQLESLVNERIAADGLKLHLSQGAPGQLAVAGEVATPLGNITLRAHAHVSVDHGRLHLALDPQDLQQLPGIVRDVLTQAVPTSFELPTLPMGFVVTSASVDASGVNLVAQAQHTVLALR